MNTSDRPDPELLKRALHLLETSRQALSSELARRARAIEEGQRRGTSWDEVKREILGRPP